MGEVDLDAAIREQLDQMRSYAEPVTWLATAVLGLHQRERLMLVDPPYEFECQECEREWPCATVRVVARELGVAQ